jgi:DNA polymerase-1
VNPNPDKDAAEKLLPLSDRQIAMFRKELPKYKCAIYHNGKFDTRVLNRVLGCTLNVWFDTMLAHHVLNMAAGEHGLKILAMRYFGADDWESGIKSYLRGGGYYERIPPNLIGKYNGWDVYWTYMLWTLFAPQIEADENNQMAFELEMAEARMLLKVERVGIPFSREAANALAAQKLIEMSDAVHALRESTGIGDFNPNSPQQVKRYLHSKGWKVTTTNAEAIEQVKEDARKDDDEQIYNFCEELIKFRKASKVRGTYADGWSKHARDDGTGQYRVYPTFLVHGTSTGRLSSTAPNAQNMPRDKEVRQIVALNKVSKE